MSNPGIFSRELMIFCGTSKLKNVGKNGTQLRFGCLPFKSQADMKASEERKWCFNQAGWQSGKKVDSCPKINWDSAHPWQFLKAKEGKNLSELQKAEGGQLYGHALLYSPLDAGSLTLQMLSYLLVICLQDYNGTVEGVGDSHSLTS